MKKLFFVCLLCLLLPFSAMAAENVHIGALKGPTAMGMVQMMDAAQQEELPYEFTIAAAIDEITPQLVQGNLDISAIPANLSSVLYNNTQGQIKVLAINTLGVIYIVESGESVQSVEDLRGKTIYASGKGATPEYALNFVLQGNGIDPEKDVTIEWKAEHAECAAALASKENAIAMLPQPFVTVAMNQNENIRIALDMTEEWEKIVPEDAYSTMITGVVVARSDYIDENPEAIAQFMDRYAVSAEYAMENIPETAALIEAYDIVPAAIAEKALPYCNIAFMEGEEMRTALEGYLGVLFEQNPESIGGQMPDDAFYYAR